MQALVLTDHGPELIDNLPTPIPGPGEALLAPRLVGICGTDLALVAGYKGGYRGVLGHEYVAEVVAAPGYPEWVGCRVVGEINTTCGVCDSCRAGHVTHCQTRRVLGIRDWDGVFAEYFLSPVANLHRLPDEISDAEAVFTEPLAAAYAVLREMPKSSGDRIAILGDGRLGLLIALVLRAEGYDPLLIGRHQNKLDIANAAGIQTTTHVEAARRFDVLIEATGLPHILPEVIDMAAPRATIILKSTGIERTQIDASIIVVNELRLIGSRCGPFAEAIVALAAGKIDPKPLISSRFPLNQAVAALESAAQSGVIKVLLEPNKPSPLQPQML
ncbi:MAG: alcohol dehydrogenase catalytic domain-containing protein [Caldilineales bacterium]|nr:alcohol dehydrogenase catalytic domain-containing protein [Caldilineales bacterium]